MKKTIFISILILVNISLQAQFLEELGKKIEKAAERTIEKKSEQKTEKLSFHST